MIIDRLANPTPLYQLPSRLARALEYLRATDMRTVAPGRHDLDGDDLFALVQEYTTRPADQCVWEVTIRAGMFAIFGPEDVHSPCHVAGEPGVVRKVVVKATA